MAPQPGIQTITKKMQQDNEIWSIKIRQNKRNIFLQKLRGKLGKVTSSRPLIILKKLNMR